VPCILNEIGQVFLNLIVNAAQAIAEKFGISRADSDQEMEKMGQISISSESLGNSVAITVTDSGCGISEENLGKNSIHFIPHRRWAKAGGRV